MTANRCRRHRGNSWIYSPASMTTPPRPATPTITPDEIQTALATERPELVEDWTSDQTLPDQMARIAANAQWLWERNEQNPSPWASTLRATGELRQDSISHAIWMATRDDLYNENTFDRDPDAEPLGETQLRSGWFST